LSMKWLSSVPSGLWDTVLKGDRKEKRMKANGGNYGTVLHCSFCGKSQDEVKKLIAGPTVYICDECIELL